MVLHKFMLDPQTVKKVYRTYGLKNVELKGTQTGYRNHSFPALEADGTAVNLILYKSEPHILQKIKTANCVSDFLYKNSFPARYTKDPRIMKLKTTQTEHYAALYGYLPGDTIPWEAYTRKHLKILGDTMARMHKILRAMPREDAPGVAAEYIKIIKRMKNYFEDPAVVAAMQAKLDINLNEKVFNRYSSLLEVSRKLHDQQMLHMDFVRGNILFDKKNGELFASGILDFEKAGYGHILLDIARTLSFLIVDCKYKDSAAIHKHFLISGYLRSGGAELNDIVFKHNAQKISLLYELTSMFATYDFYKFLKHNPYEYLNQNEHFVRTQNLLARRGVITTSPHAR